MTKRDLEAADIAPFDYGALSEEIRNDALATRDRIRERMHRTSAELIEIGRDLYRMKAALGHGNFTQWAASEFKMSYRMAEHYISVFNTFGKSEDTSFMATMGQWVTIMISAPSMPVEVREAVVAKVEAGEQVTLADVERMKKDWKREHDKLEGVVTELTVANQKLKETKTRAVADRAAAGGLVEAAYADNRRLREEIDVIRAELAAERRKRVMTDSDAVRQYEMQRLLDAWDAASDEVKSDFRTRISGGGTIIQFNREVG